MPVWTATLPTIGLRRGVPETVFAAEALSDAEASVAVALPLESRGGAVDITFDIEFGSTPTTVDYLLQIAMNNVDAEFYDIVGSNMTDTAGGKVTINGVVGRFARVKAVDADTETVTSRIMV